MIEASSRSKARSLCFIGFVLACFNLARASHCGQDYGGCVDSYWADFWLISYSDGYDRRALIGQVVRSIFGESISFISLNLMAFAIALLCIASLIAVLFSRSRQERVPANGVNWALFSVAVACGPMTAVFVEVLGDPLQASFLLVILYACLAPRLKSTAARGLVALVTMALVTAIHEASIFLFFPTVLLILGASDGKAASLKLILLVVGCAAIGSIVFLDHQNPHSRGLALVEKNAELYFPSDEALPPFATLLKMELMRYFGTIKGPFGLVLKIAGSLLVPIFLLLTYARLQASRLPLQIFIPLLIPSLPLYVVAHDWGRFLVYTLWLDFLLCESFGDRLKLRDSQFREYWVDKAVSAAGHLSGLLPPICILAPVFLVNPSYRLGGVDRESLALLAAALAIYVIVTASNRTRSR